MTYDYTQGGAVVPPPNIPVAPYVPPASGGSGGSGGFPVGYGQGGGQHQAGQGDNYGQGHTVVGQLGSGSAPLPPQFPWGAFNQANQQSQNAINSGLAALMGGMSVKSPFGQQVGSIFSSPYGLPPELLAQQRRMLAETAAGSRENALLRSGQAARASGFGDSLGAIRAGDMIRTQSAADLNNANVDLSVQDALLQMQRQAGMGGLMAQLYGIDAGLLGNYANLQAGRQFPIMPGGTGQQGGMPWGAPQSPGWSQSGQWMPQGVGYDPFYGGGGPGTGQGAGYTPQNPWRPW